MTPVAPRSVRYIKLGEGGEWEQDCLAKAVLRIGFATGELTMTPLLARRDWDGVAGWWRRKGRSASTATRFTNEVRLYLEDEGATLWITFIGEDLWWGTLEPGSVAVPQADDRSSTRALKAPWSNRDAHGTRLTKNVLAGGLTQLSGYRGTSCSVGMADYVVRRINGQVSLQVERAIAAQRQMEAATLDLVRLLGPNDF